MSKPLSRQVKFARISYHLSVEERVHLSALLLGGPCLDPPALLRLGAPLCPSLLA